MTPAPSSHRRLEKEIAGNLGAFTNTPREWVRRAKAEGRPSKRLMWGEREELLRLRCENRVLKKEQEIFEKPQLSSPGRPTGSLLPVRGAKRGRPRHITHVSTADFSESPKVVSIYSRTSSIRKGTYRRGTARTIKMILRQSWGNSGAPRVQTDLRRKHYVRCSKRRVARLMRQARRIGMCRGKKKSMTKRVPSRTASPDLVKRDFTAATADNIWVADITQHKTHEGWLYLAVVIDIFVSYGSGPGHVPSSLR